MNRRRQKRSYSVRDSITTSFSSLSLNSIISTVYKKSRIEDTSNLTSLDVLDSDSINNNFILSECQLTNIPTSFDFKLDFGSSGNMLPMSSELSNSIALKSSNKEGVLSKSEVLPKVEFPKPPISPESSCASMLTTSTHINQHIDCVKPQTSLERYKRLENEVKNGSIPNSCQEGQDTNHYKVKFDQTFVSKIKSKKFPSKMKSLFSHNKKVSFEQPYKKRRFNDDNFDVSGLNLLKLAKNPIQPSQNNNKKDELEPVVKNQCSSHNHNENESCFCLDPFNKELYPPNHFLSLGSNENLIGSLTYILSDELVDDSIVDKSTQFLECFDTSDKTMEDETQQTTFLERYDYN